MTHQVSLSEDAYAKLRKERRGGESFSRAVLRLLVAARRRARDPERFLGARFEFTTSAGEHERLVESLRQADRAG